MQQKHGTSVYIKSMNAALWALFLSHNLVSDIQSLADYQTLNMRIEPDFQLIREPVTLSKVKIR